MSYLTIAEFRKKAGTVSDPKLWKDYPATVEPVSDRSLRFVISTDDIDRMGDKVTQDGWLLANYLRNPVVLGFHDDRSLPIGKCVDIRVEDGKLKALVEFVPPDMPVVGGLADAIFRMCQEGFLSGASVGFVPVAWDKSDDEARNGGFDFQVCELLEFSIVPIPANPFALMERSLSVDTDADKAIEPITGSDGIVLNRNCKALTICRAKLRLLSLPQ